MNARMADHNLFQEMPLLSSALLAYTVRTVPPTATPATQPTFKLRKRPLPPTTRFSSQSPNPSIACQGLLCAPMSFPVSYTLCIACRGGRIGRPSGGVCVCLQRPGLTFTLTNVAAHAMPPSRALLLSDFFSFPHPHAPIHSSLPSLLPGHFSSEELGLLKRKENEGLPVRQDCGRRRRGQAQAGGVQFRWRGRWYKGQGLELRWSCQARRRRS